MTRYRPTRCMRPVVWLISLLLPWLSGCAMFGTGEPDTLDEWLDTELTPYLVETLTTSPRFKNKPFIIVGLDNESIRTEIDDVTRYLRDRLRDRLLAVPDIQLVRRQTGDATVHHRSLDQVVCDQEQDIQFYLGLDVRRDSLTGKLSVAVRALDAQANLGWISGFGLHFSGDASEREQRALAMTRKDTFLRGLRAFPFTAAENDLAANYLSHNLSCLLREYRDGGILLHITRESNDASDHFATLFDLVDDYVTRFNEVTLTQNPELANTLLTMSVHTLDRRAGLHLVAVAMQRRVDGVRVGGVATQTYVQSSAAVSSSRHRIALRLAQQQAALARAEAESRSVPVTTPPPEVAEPVNPTPLIASLTGRVPRDARQACRQPAPWVEGVRRINSGDSLRSGECFALEVALHDDAYVHLLYQNPTGDVFRLFPSACEGLEGPVRIEAHHVALYPSPDGSIPAIGLGNVTGMERVYVVAVRDGSVQQQLTTALADFPDACSSGQVPSPTQVANWESTLNRWLQQWPGSLEWRSFLIQHK